MFRKPQFLRAIALALTILSSGCAIGTHIRYHRGIALSLPLTTHPIRIATVDRRACVLQSSCTADWVGVQRSLIGIPYSVCTESHNSLAGDLARLIGESLQHSGADVEYRSLPVGFTDDEIARDAETHHVRSSLVLVLREWRTETWMHTTLHYDLVLLAFASEGKLLETEEIKGIDQITEENPKRATLSAAVSDILLSLLSRPSIASVLSEETDGAPPSSAGELAASQAGNDED